MTDKVLQARPYWRVILHRQHICKWRERNKPQSIIRGSIHSARKAWIPPEAGIMPISASKVQYLGHGISSEGIRPLLTKLDAITKAPIPQNLQQLR